MFTSATTIGKVVARCSAAGDRLPARLRLEHLLRGLDLAPQGFPPHSILIIRRTLSTRPVPLGAFRLGPEWERAAREEVTRRWRRAAHPERGRVPADAEAVCFADVGEWLACLGVAAEARDLVSHWCWRATVAAHRHTAPAQVLAHEWAGAARFIPAAVARLTCWGAAARVLRVFGAEESGTLLAALGAEFGLSRAVAPGRAFTRSHLEEVPSKSLASQPSCETRGSTEVAQPGASGESDEAFAGSRPWAVVAPRGETRAGPQPRAGELRAPWRRWVPSAGDECERLPAQTQRLLAVAVAVFHDLRRARSHAFAEEISIFVERLSASSSTRPPRRGLREVSSATRRLQTQEGSEPSSGTDAAAGVSGEVFEAAAGGARGAQTSRVSATDSTACGAPHGPFSDEEAEAADGSFNTFESVPGGEGAEAAAALERWAEPGGQETKLCGLLFLLNLFLRLRLPECFDEAFGLSEHLSGWGLADLFGRTMLGGACAGHEGDALWDALARLDGREEGEPPAPRLRVGDTYRAPSRWLKLFGPDEGDAAWDVYADGARLWLLSPRGFCIVERPLGGMTVAEAAARESERYRAAGVRASLGDEKRRAPDSFEVGLEDFGRRRLSPQLLRWMNWTFPFMKYALVRSLAPGGGSTCEEAVRELLLRRGRLYCTATHVDLVMEMGGVSLPARRAGLDASPGWLPDLMRVVTFHYV